MQFKRFIFPVLFFAATTVVFAADDARPVALSETAPAVQKTIAAQIGDGKLGDIDRSDEKDEPAFDVSFTTKAGDEHDFSVAADGTLLSVEVEMSETPAAVQKTI